MPPGSPIGPGEKKHYSLKRGKLKRAFPPGRLIIERQGKLSETVRKLAGVGAGTLPATASHQSDKFGEEALAPHEAPQQQNRKLSW